MKEAHAAGIGVERRKCFQDGTTPVSQAKALNESVDKSKRSERPLHMLRNGVLHTQKLEHEDSVQVFDANKPAGKVVVIERHSGRVLSVDSGKDKRQSENSASL